MPNTCPTHFFTLKALCPVCSLSFWCSVTKYFCLGSRRRQRFHQSLILQQAQRQNESVKVYPRRVEHHGCMASHDSVEPLKSTPNFTYSLVREDSLNQSLHLASSSPSVEVERDATQQLFISPTRLRKASTSHKMKPYQNQYRTVIKIDDILWHSRVITEHSSWMSTLQKKSSRLR